MRRRVLFGCQGCVDARSQCGAQGRFGSPRAGGRTGGLAISVAVTVAIRFDTRTAVAVLRRAGRITVHRCPLSRCCRPVKLHNPVDKSAVAFATFGLTDRERLMLPDTKFDQFVSDNRRHIHNSSVGERVHDLIAKASLHFQSIRICQHGGHRHIGLKYNSFFHTSPPECLVGCLLGTHLRLRHRQSPDSVKGLGE